MDRDISDLSLAEYTKKAIELLDNPEGFFIMVEGGKIDWACHANDAAASIKDTLAFDEAVQVSVNFMNRHPAETLIVVTGDHECGGMTLGFAGQGYETNFGLLAVQKKSATDFFADELVSQYKKSMTARDFDKALEAVEEYFGLVSLSQSEKSALEKKAEAGDKDAAMKLALSLSEYELKLIRDAYNRSLQGEKERANDQETYLLYGGYDPFAVTLSHILNQKVGIGWTSYSHTGVPVPTFAAGVGAEMFDGYYDNTDIAKKMMEIMKFSMVLASVQ